MKADQYGTPTEQARFRVGWLGVKATRAAGTPLSQVCVTCRALARSPSGKGWSCAAPMPAGLPVGWATDGRAWCRQWAPMIEEA